LSMSYGARAEHAKQKVTRELFKLMERKESNLVVAADKDFESPRDVMEFARELASDIVGLKFHPRIYARWGWFCNRLDEELFDLAKEHEFVVINDTKLGDIGKIMFRQLEVELANAHLVTTHGIQGYHALKAINDLASELESKDGVARGAIVLAYMTPEGHMFDLVFDRLIDDSNEHGAAGVVIAGKEVGALYHGAARLELGIAILSPGIRIKGKKGERGQIYGHPYHATKHGADVIIVGSGIYKASDAVKAARNHRKEGWEGYLARIR